MTESTDSRPETAASPAQPELGHELTVIVEQERQLDELRAEVAEVTSETGADKLLTDLDPGTQRHSYSVSEAALSYAVAAGWSREQALALGFAMETHDVGKANEEIKALITGGEAFVGEEGAAKRAKIGEHATLSGILIGKCLDDYLAKVGDSDEQSAKNVALLKKAQWLGKMHHTKVGAGELSPEDDVFLNTGMCIDIMDAMLDSHRRYLDSRGAKEGSSDMSVLEKARVEIILGHDEPFAEARARLEADPSLITRFEEERLGGAGKFEEILRAVEAARDRLS